MVRCRHDGQHIVTIAPQHDALGETIARDVAFLSRASGRHGKFVRDLLVLEFSVVRYLLSVGAMDMTSPPVRYANIHREVFRTMGGCLIIKTNIGLPSASCNLSFATKSIAR